MIRKTKPSDFTIAADQISDDSLEAVSGGYFGKTDHTVTVTSRTYKSWAGSSPDQILLLGACWGGPCVLANQTMETLAAENPSYQVGIADVDENPDFWAAFVKAIPTTIKYHNGIMIEKIEGNQPISVFRKLF